jgi:hypothetical protein
MEDSTIFIIGFLNTLRVGGTVGLLVRAAKDDNNPERTAVKSKQVAALEAGLRRCTIRWFEKTDHDVHVHRPEALATVLLETLETGIWRER